MTDYEWLSEMGLCHRCRKEKAAPERKYCFDCLEKMREENAKRYDAEKAKLYQPRRREIYQEKKEKGICVRCNKPATHGIYCYECSIKTKRTRKERSAREREKRHNEGLIPEQRKEKHLCLWCGKAAVEGKNCCEEHGRIFQEAGRKAREMDKWSDEFWKLMKALRSSKDT